MKKPSGRLAQVNGISVEVDTKEHYNAWAEDYDRDLLDEYGYTAHQRAAVALAGAVADKQAAIIDLGCGTGLVGRELAALGYTRVDGLDFSPGMLAKARASGAYRQIYQDDLKGRTQIADCAYDGTICAGLFGAGHLDPENILELLRIVKPGAPIIIYMNALPYEQDDYQAEFARLTEAGNWRVERIESSNYMDEIDRPGRLVVARKAPAR